MTAGNAKETTKETIIRKMKMFLVTAALVFACQLAFGARTAHAAETPMGEQVIEYASQFIGNPYRWGGSSLTNGTDCSGFVMSVYANFGISLPHSLDAMAGVGSRVSGGLANALPGDIIVYDGHVGIYLGSGRLLSALNSRKGITINSASYKAIESIRRVL